MTYAYPKEFREGARKQLESDQAELHFMRTEWKGVEETTALILQRVYLNGPGAPCAWQERLKSVPKQLTVKMKDAAMTTTIQSLAMMKSHYPGVDLKHFEEGYTADTDEAKLETLSLEVEPIAELLVELLDLEDL